MKKYLKLAISILVAVFTLSTLNFAYAVAETTVTNEKTFTYEFTGKLGSNDVTLNSTSSDEKIDFYFSDRGQSMDTDNSQKRGLQFGTSKKPLKNLTIETKNSYNFTFVEVETCGASGGNGSFVLSVGTSKVLSQSYGEKSTKHNYTFDKPETGVFNLVYTVKTKAFYIKSITLKYTDVPDTTPSIKISAASTENFYIGDKVSLNVIMKNIPDSTEILWISTDEKVATVSDGVITLIKAGEATVSAMCEVDGKTVESNELSFKVTRDPATIPEITISSTENYVYIGETLSLTIEQKNLPVPTQLEWSSSDESVATVDNGVVTALKAGEVKISAMCEVGEDIVESNKLVLKVMLNPELEPKIIISNSSSEDYYYVGEQIQLELAKKNIDDSVEIEWDLTDESYSVSADNVVTLLKAGEIVITAYCEVDGEIVISNEITLIVLPKEGSTLTVSEALKFCKYKQPTEYYLEGTIVALSSTDNFMLSDSTGSILLYYKGANFKPVEGTTYVVKGKLTIYQTKDEINAAEVKVKTSINVENDSIEIAAQFDSDDNPTNIRFIVTIHTADLESLDRIDLTITMTNTDESKNLVGTKSYTTVYSSIQGYKEKAENTYYIIVVLTDLDLAKAAGYTSITASASLYDSSGEKACADATLTQVKTL